MKKLLFLFGIILISASLSAQRVFIYDSIPFPAGTDTTIYRMLYSVDNWSFNFNYGALDAADGTLDLGGVDVADGTAFDRLDDLRLPFTLADSTVAFEKSNFSFRYVAIKFTVNSCTSGTIYFRITKR
jgi:hypothetical protein